MPKTSSDFRLHIDSISQGGKAVLPQCLSGRGHAPHDKCFICTTSAISHVSRMPRQRTTWCATRSPVTKLLVSLQATGGQGIVEALKWILDTKAGAPKRPVLGQCVYMDRQCYWRSREDVHVCHICCHAGIHDAHVCMINVHASH